MRFGSATLVSHASMSANVTSNIIDVAQEWMFAIQAIYSGSPLGTLKLQASTDNVPAQQQVLGADQQPLVVNWADITSTLSSTSIVTGTTSFLYNQSFPGFRWIRLVYVASSGIGDLTVQYFGKG